LRIGVWGPTSPLAPHRPSATLAKVGPTKAVPSTGRQPRRPSRGTPCAVTRRRGSSGVRRGVDMPGQQWEPPAGYDGADGSQPPVPTPPSPGYADPAGSWTPTPRHGAAPAQGRPHGHSPQDADHGGTATPGLGHGGTPHPGAGRGGWQGGTHPYTSLPWPPRPGRQQSDAFTPEPGGASRHAGRTPHVPSAQGGDAPAPWPAHHEDAGAGTGGGASGRRDGGWVPGTPSQWPPRLPTGVDPTRPAAFPEARPSPQWGPQGGAPAT